MNMILLIVVGLLVTVIVTALVNLNRSIFSRIAASVIAFGFSAFCAFGYLASFELSSSPISPWHLAYGFLGLGSLVAGLFSACGIWKIKKSEELANG